jgi:hypothetical protein
MIEPAWRAALLRLILFSLAAGATLEVHLTPPEGVRERLERGAVDAKARQATIHKLFEEAGCTVEEQRVGRNTANVICELPGTTDSTVIVGGHFDFAEKGQGIVDDWSGAALLPSLYEALKEIPRRHKFIFVAFAEEERGLVGSARFVKELSNEQRLRVRAFVNLECLGLGPTKVWVHRATPALVSRLSEVASSIHAPIGEMDVEKIGDDDSHPFLSAHMPVITLHSMTPDTLNILHSVRDKMSAIRAEDYYASYKLAALYLAYLDVETE